MNFSLFTKNVDELKEMFARCSTPDDRYKKIIELGSLLPTMHAKDKSKENLVPGCQSQLYLKVILQDDRFMFTAHSDALISKGLAALLYLVYNGLPPLVVLKEPPTFLKDLAISSSLSPSRSNGVLNIYLKMQQRALLLITQSAPA